MGKYRVWQCKVVISADTSLPDGFDFEPRFAAQKAIEAGLGNVIIVAFSGWGGTLTTEEMAVATEMEAKRV